MLRARSLTPAALDYETDEIIQASLRRLVAKDVSVLTIAHRLRTVMDSDKIVRVRMPSVHLRAYTSRKQMVLDAGRIVSFMTTD